MLKLCSFLALALLIGKGASAEEGVPVHGFADIQLGTSSNVPAEYETQRVNGFSLGNVDLFLTPSLGGKFRSLIELVLESDKSSGAIGIDTERVQIGYSLSDNATFWVGRYHTPFGAWNTAYHHGGQLQTTIMRPRFIDFEDIGGVLPTHGVGMLFHNSTGLIGTSRLSYDVYAANGSRLAVVDAATGTGGGLDFNYAKADRAGGMVGTNIAVGVGSGMFEGLKVGVHGYSTIVQAYSDESTKVTSKVGSAINQTMVGGYVHLDSDNAEVISEYYHITDKDDAAGAVERTSELYFAEVMVPVGSWKPYLMYERANLDKNDSYFKAQANAMNYDRSTVGLRYELSPTTTAKLQWSATHSNDLDVAGVAYGDYSTVVSQLAVRF